MKRFLASITLASSLTLGVIGILQADVLSGQSVTDRYLSGQLDTRLTELGTNLQTGDFFPTWKKTQETGVRLHCVRTLIARGVKNTAQCSR